MVADSERRIRLRGRLMLTGTIEALTGLHIGGSAGALAIGNVDQPVIRNSLTNEPYIPGSSLKGRLRSLLERQRGAAQTQEIGKQVRIHNCNNVDDYQNCPICNVFGIPARDWCDPTRIAVRDVALTRESVAALREARTDLPFTEVKWEAAIDRLTSAASPRQLERVPAGAVFGPMEMVYSVYREADISFFGDLLTALQLLEDDALGGQSSRGSGRVRLRDLTVTARAAESYDSEQQFEGTFDGVPGLLARREDLELWLLETLDTSAD